MSTVADQCMYGLMTPSDTELGEAPAMKPTQFIGACCTNSQFAATRAIDINRSWEVEPLRLLNTLMTCAKPSAVD